jgi:hypothetical protein
MATWMIGYTAYKQVRLEAKAGISLSGTRLLIILVESGVVYIAMQIIRLALYLAVLPSTPPTAIVLTVQEVFQKLGVITSAIYSPALILIINNKCSVADAVRLKSQQVASAGAVSDCQWQVDSLSTVTTPQRSGPGMVSTLPHELDAEG